jgi:hypothetical protein
MVKKMAKEPFTKQMEINMLETGLKIKKQAKESIRLQMAFNTKVNS